MVVDVFYSRMLPNDPVSHPQDTHRRRVLAQQGEILHIFQLPAFRVRVRAENIPKLSEGDSVFVFEVLNVRRYDWSVNVIYREGVRFDSTDEAVFARLGGRITHRLDAANVLIGLIPDRSIPELRRHARVHIVEANGRFCPGG